VPLVSVVIPLYNKERYITTTLRSVLSQTLQDLQIIVVDDGSTDQSAMLARSIGDHRVRVVTQENAGVEIARNTGLKASDSRFIVFLDADDVIYPQCLEQQSRRLEGDSALVAVATWAHQIDAKGRVIGRLRCPPTDRNIRYQMCFSNPFVNSSVMTLRSVIESIDGYDTTRGPRFAEDYDLWLRLSTRGSLGAVPRYLTAYRLLNESRSQSSLTRLQNSANLLSCDYLSRLYGLQDEPLLQELIAVLNSAEDARKRKFTYQDLSQHLNAVQRSLKQSINPNSLRLHKQRIELFSRCFLFRRIKRVDTDSPQ